MNKQLLKETINNENVIILFSADWCGACKATSPYVQKIVERLRFKFIKIEENEELEQEYGVDYYPHLILASKGKIKHYPGGNEIKSLYESII
jgi:thiol-disulfide isomerase/thioredoxin